MITLVIAETGESIGPEVLLSLTWRTDLTPVPSTLEFSVRRSASLEKALVAGAVVLIGGNALPMKLVKVEPVKSGQVQGGERMGWLYCLAVLAGMASLILPANKAVIQSGGGFSGALMACGSSVVAHKDIPLPNFVCLKGQVPTFAIARYLQQEAAAICLKGDKVEVWRLTELAKQEPSATFESALMHQQASPEKVRLLVPSAFSVASDGSQIENDQIGYEQRVRYEPRLTTRQLRNLERVLIHRGTLERAFNPSRLQAGNCVSIGDESLVILTAAHHLNTGAMGGEPSATTKVWLSAMG